MLGDKWEIERKIEKSKSYKEPSERPTFRTHQFSKSAQEREKKHSVASTQNTEKMDSLEGKGSRDIF